MFDRLFTQAAARARHRAGPLAAERLAFLTHLADQGTSPGSLRSAAGYLLVVTALLHLAERPGEVIRRDEIKRTSLRWANRRARKFGWKGGRDATTRFHLYSTRWLRFLGRLEQSSTPPSPHADTLAAFADYMLRERNFSPATVRGRSWFAERFLDHLAARGASLHEVTIVQIDDLFRRLLSRGDLSRAAIGLITEKLLAFLRYAECERLVPQGLGVGGPAPARLRSGVVADRPILG